jgi:hypothetical protein
MNYHLTKRIPIDKLTKAELLHGIKTMVMKDAIIDRIESEVYWKRCHDLVAEMRKQSDIMSACQQSDAFDYEAQQRRQRAQLAWDKAHQKLNKLQGT